MEYNQIKSKYRNGNMIKSLTDGVVRKYSGYLTLVGIGENQEGYDSFNKNIVVYQNGRFAEIVEQGIDEHEQHIKHIDNVLNTCNRLGCTPAQLLRKDYAKELQVK